MTLSTKQPKRTRRAHSTEVRLRVLADSSVAMGPGKADLLDAIAETGSSAQPLS